MLRELRITDFAIIDSLNLNLEAGFLVITGETGAGKSIIVDAISLLLGERSDVSLVRGGANRAVIEGVFAVPEAIQPDITKILEREGLDSETSAEVTLTREVRANGRSYARINGVLCNLAVYRAVGALLVDIHGQSEHLSLLKPAQHLYLLDRFANLDDAREIVRVLVRELKQVRAQIQELLTDEAALAQRVDMLQYQVEEIRVADPRPEEEEALRQERGRLVNAERLAELATEAQFLLSGDESDAVGAEDLLAQVAVLLAKLVQIDPALVEESQLAEALNAQSEELARSLRTYREGIEYDPHRLDEIEERLEVLNRLKRKYGGSIPAVLEYARQAEAELDSITHSEEQLAALREREERILRRIGEQAAQLSRARQQAAKRLTRGMVSELADLRMEKARFEVRFEQVDDPEGCFVGERRLAFDATGIDRLEFYMAANVGEPLRPLAKVASGGETSRIMLALKTVLSHADQVPTLIFDEIDQGIGGRIGSVVGQKLWGLSGRHQVLVVTHLAQLAGFGDIHYRVSKHVESDRTVTRVVRLDDQGRVEELAEMLGAETASARQSAYDILMLARRIKEGRHLETV